MNNTVNTTSTVSEINVTRGHVRKAVAMVRDHEAELVDARGRPVEFFVRVKRKDGSTYSVPARLTLAVAMQIASGGVPVEDGLDKAILKATPGGQLAIDRLRAVNPDLRRSVRRRRPVNSK